MSSTPAHAALVAFVIGCLATWLVLNHQSTNCPSSTGLRLDGGTNNAKQQKYQGVQYWKDGFTLGVQTLYETRFARFQIHKVKLDNGKNTIVDDWLWYDESDNVNVLVQTQDGKFQVMKQTKYGLTGSTYAVVGGLIEKNELPVKAAQREVQEELGLTCLDDGNGDSNNWQSLGAYKAAANRGGGTTHTFWARNCRKIGADNNKDGAVAVGEAERQSLVQLTKEELLQALLEGKFQEIKWTATVALALLKNDHA